MAELINKTDTLNEGRVKLNEAITDAEQAKGLSEQALANSESTQTQLDTIVIDGDSSVEAAQARVSADGTAYGTLKQRLDSEHASVTSQLVQKVDQVVFDIATQEIKFFAEGSLVSVVDVTEASNASLVQDYIDTLVADGTIEGISLAPGAVSTRELGFVKRSSNLANVNATMKNSFIDHNNGGIIAPSDINQVFDLMKVRPGELYTYRGFGKIAFYDGSKNFISHISTITSEIKTVTIPDNCFWIRMQSPMANDFNEQLNIGDTLLPYEPYYVNLDNNEIGLEDNSVTFRERTPIGHVGFLHNLSGPNIDLTNKRVILNKPIWITLGTDRYEITGEGTIEVELHPSSSYQYIVYNTRTNDFKMKFSSTASPAVFDEFDIIVMFLTFSNSVTNLEHAFCTTKITVNGKPYPNHGEEPVNYKFVPEVPSYEYTAETLPPADGTVDFDHHETTAEEVYAKYDELIANHSTYLTKTLFGNDSSGTLPIYQLELNPEIAIEKADRKSLPTIIINCAMHGDGSGGFGDGSPGDPPTHAYSMYYLVKEICENWKSSKALEYLRWNVRFVIIPIANPWGFNNKSRYTVNGVDINRDFDNMSQIETQYIRDVYINNQDAIASVDYHMIGGLEFIQDDRLIRYFINQDDEASYQICEHTMRQLSRRWNGKYGLSKIPFYGTASATSGNDATLRGWGYYTAGIPTITLEGFLATNAHREKSGSVAMTMNVEHLGNWIMNAVRYFYNK